VDRWSIRRTLVGTQVIQAVVVAVIPIAQTMGALRVELVLVVMPLLAALNQFVYPAQAAALPRLLDDEELVAANSAFSIAYQGLDMVANGIGGLLIAAVGAVSLFAIDAVTFAVAATVFLTISVPAAGESDRSQPQAGTGTPEDSVAADGGERDRAGGTGPADDTAGETSATEGADEPYLDRLRDGIAVLRGSFLLWLILGALVVNFTSGMVLAAIPVYADSLAVPAAVAAIGAAGAYGVLMAAFAAGNFLGAITANAVSEYPLGWTMIAGFAASGVLWTAAIGLSWLPVTAVLIVVALLPVGAVNIQLAAVVQSAPPEEYVGRVSSLLGSASTAMIPIGSLAGGAVAATLGPRAAMLALGIGSLGLALYVLAHPTLRGLAAPDEVSIDVPSVE
jgi:MFS family permease